MQEIETREELTHIPSAEVSPEPEKPAQKPPEELLGDKITEAWRKRDLDEIERLFLEAIDAVSDLKELQNIQNMSHFGTSALRSMVSSEEARYQRVANAFKSKERELKSGSQPLFEELLLRINEINEIEALKKITNKINASADLLVAEDRYLLTRKLESKIAELEAELEKALVAGFAAEIAAISTIHEYENTFDRRGFFARVDSSPLDKSARDHIREIFFRRSDELRREREEKALQALAEMSAKNRDICLGLIGEAATIEELTTQTAGLLTTSSRLSLDDSKVVALALFSRYEELKQKQEKEN